MKVQLYKAIKLACKLRFIGETMKIQRSSLVSYSQDVSTLRNQTCALNCYVLLLSMI